LHERGFQAREARPRKITSEVQKAKLFEQMPKSFLRIFSHEVQQYYDYRGRYEFTRAPLSYYERQKIKFKLRRYYDDLYKLDNCRVINIGYVSGTKYKRSMYLYNNNLTHLTPIISNFKSLIILDLSSNNLTKIPSIIGKLKSLEWFSVSNNQLTELPSIICNLKSLVILELSYNQLTNLPPLIGNLISLRYLSVFRNQLTELPSSISNLVLLQNFYLHDNQLTYDYISHIHNLLPNCQVR